MNLRTQIVLPLLLTLAVLGTVAVGAVVQLGEETAVAEASNDLETRALRAAEDVNASVQARSEGGALLAFAQAETDFATQVLDMPPEEAAKAREALAERYRRATLGLFDRVALVAREGGERAAYAGGAEAAPGSAARAEDGAAIQRFVQEPSLAPLLSVEGTAAGEVLVVRASVRDREGAVVSLVRGDVAFARILPPGLLGLRDTEVRLVEASGGSVAGASPGDLPGEVTATLGGARGGVDPPRSLVAGGTLYAVAFALPVPRTGGEQAWFLVAERPVAAATAPVLQPIYALALALAAIAVAVAAIVSLVVRRAVRPLERLSSAAEALGSGPPEGHVPPEGPAEVLTLAASFNAMVDRLRQREAALAREFDSRAQNAKFATLGSLSSGVAHEIKNPLTGMRLQAQLLQRLADRAAHGDAEAQRELPDAAWRTGDLSQRGIERIERVVASLTLLARPRADVEEVEVAPVVEASIALAGARLRGRVEVEAEVVPGLRALANTDGLGQVLLNLVSNAADAVPDPGGRIRITAARAEGRRVRIAVEDNGPGIPPEVAERLGEPFFTTKKSGTGLGLSVSQRIVRELGGNLRHENLPEGGARFEVELPAPPEAEATRKEGTAASTTPEGRLPPAARRRSATGSPREGAGA